MSHITKIEAEIKNIEALKSACQVLGYTFSENQKTYKWFGRNNKCEHAIQVPGASYEIGVVKTEKGFSLEYDTFSSYGRELAKAAPIIVQQYSAQYVSMIARRKGQSVTQSRLANGSIRLKITGRM